MKNRLKIGAILVSGLQKFAVGKPALTYSQTSLVYRLDYVLHQALLSIDQNYIFSMKCPGP